MKQIFLYTIKWIVAFCYPFKKLLNYNRLVCDNEEVRSFIKHLSKTQPKRNETKVWDSFFLWQKNQRASTQIGYLVKRIPTLLLGFSYFRTYYNQIQWPYQPVDWNKDASSGYKWSRYIYYPLVRSFSRKKKVEVKFPWEVSRMHHLVEYSFTEKVTNVKKIYLNHLCDFMFSNPFQFGINWVCTMDVSIRAVNLLITYYILLHRGCTFDSLQKRIINSTLWMHADYIYNNLEKPSNSVPGNHYYSNVAALFILSSSFEFNDQSKNWLQFSYKEFWKLTDSIFNEDGTSYECSTAYHRLVFEMFFYTFLFMTGITSEQKRFLISTWGVDVNKFIKNGDIHLEAIKEFISKNRTFLEAISKPDGTFYQIGDNDSGRFINFDFLYRDEYFQTYSSQHIQRSVYTLQKQLSTFDHKNVIINSELPDSNTLELRGFKEIEKKSFDLDNDIILYNRFYFPDFGLFILKSYSNYIGLRCGGLKGKLTHAHEDQLSLELTLNGKNIYRDKGSYTYTQFPEIRNKFRSQLFHNCPSVNEVEQANIKKGVFSFIPLVTKEKMYFYESEESLFVAGEIFIGKNTLIRVLNICQDKFEVIDYSNNFNLYNYSSIDRINVQPYSPEYGIVINSEQNE